MTTHTKILTLVVLSSLFAGCSSSPDKGADSSMANRFAIPTAASVRSTAYRSTQSVPITISSAPEVSARKRPEDTPEEPGYDPEKEPIKVQLLNYWEDGSNYHTNVIFRNQGPQILKTIFVFGYDRLGRLVSTQNSQTFFRAKSNVVRTFRFSRRGRAVRWVMVVKN